MFVPNAWRPFFSERRYERKASTSLQILDEMEMTMVDWKRENFHCVLIQHPENPYNRSYN